MSGVASQRSSELVQAVEAVADAVRRARTIDLSRQERTAAAIEEIAEVTKDYGEKSVKSALEAIRAAMISPVDPSALTWNAFRFFEVEDREVYWTKWLASILSPENGETVSQFVWRALCDSIIAQGSEPASIENKPGVLATLDDWVIAREQVLSHDAVDREVHDPDLGTSELREAGRVDIAIDSPTIFVVIENKLDAGWHDGETEQAAKYRTFGLKRRKSGQKLGLVVLTKHPDFPIDESCADYVRITYREVARNLRRGLRRLSGDRSSSALWPAVLTIAAIEQELCGLNIHRVLATAPSWQALEEVSAVANYLRDHEERR